MSDIKKVQKNFQEKIIDKMEKDLNLLKLKIEKAKSDQTKIEENIKKLSEQYVLKNKMLESNKKLLSKLKV